MAFDKDALAKIETWLKTKATKFKCVGCGGTERWMFEPDFLSFLRTPYPVQDVDLSNAKGSAYLAVSCMDCGVIVLVSPKAVGL